MHFLSLCCLQRKKDLKGLWFFPAKMGGCVCATKCVICSNLPDIERARTSQQGWFSGGKSAGEWKCDECSEQRLWVCSFEGIPTTFGSRCFSDCCKFLPEKRDFITHTTLNSPHRFTDIPRHCTHTHIYKETHMHTWQSFSVGSQR